MISVPETWPSASFQAARVMLNVFSETNKIYYPRKVMVDDILLAPGGKVWLDKLIERIERTTNGEYYQNLQRVKTFMKKDMFPPDICFDSVVNDASDARVDQR